MMSKRPVRISGLNISGSDWSVNVGDTRRIVYMRKGCKKTEMVKVERILEYQDEEHIRDRYSFVVAPLNNPHPIMVNIENFVAYRSIVEKRFGKEATD